MMDQIYGVLKLRIQRGINLAIRDLRSSDPYVVVSMGTHQKLKTRIMHKDLNPEWNEELTLMVDDIKTPIHLKVFDKDMFSADDEMGEAVIDIRSYVKCWNKGLEKLPDGCVVKRIQPNENNYLAEESPCIWHNGTIIQRMLLKLRNVECGELLCELEWVSVLGSMGLLELQQLHA
ncbi:hypothetical protein HN51_019723 [Arachis hypogaea]|uniref:C2 domain-containing protein n=1 Tax=Arachis hypogaea TaxID=3818 RepID=A0A445BY03_ARAHY|nr:Protein C2-DOMAIN ABA-RELATED [Arachis hypogaea]RYR43597.1 hypothetical protein Ahy_A08g040020 [Arachis hypogaea]